MPKMYDWIDESSKEPLDNSTKKLFEKLNEKTQELKNLNESTRKLLEDNNYAEKSKDSEGVINNVTNSLFDVINRNTRDIKKLTDLTLYLFSKDNENSKYIRDPINESAKLLIDRFSDQTKELKELSDNTKKLLQEFKAQSELAGENNQILPDILVEKTEDLINLDESTSLLLEEIYEKTTYLKEPLTDGAKKVFDKLNGETEDLKTLVNENPKRALRAMALPAFFSLFCLTLNGLVDSIFVSTCGQASLIGVGLIQSIFSIIVGFGTGLSVATNSSLSYAISKYVSNEKARQIVDNSVVVTLIIGIIFSIIVVLILKPLLIILNIPSFALDEALTYGYVLFGGNVFFFFSAVIPAILKSEGEIIKTTYALVSTSLLNIVLDYLLIQKFGLGILGAAIATVTCSALCCSLLVIFMKRSENIKFTFENTFFHLDTQIMKRIFIDAIPVSFESIILSLFGFLANIIFNLLHSPADLAAFIASYKIYGFAIIPIIAISEGNVTITAYLFGQNKLESMKNLLKYEIKIGCLISAVFLIIISIFRDPISHLFVINNDTLQISAMNSALPLLNLLLVIMPIGLISVSILQGMQEYKKSFIISSIRSIVLEIFFGFIGVVVFHSVFAVYIGIIGGALVGCAISYFVSRNTLNNKLIESTNVN